MDMLTDRQPLGVVMPLVDFPQIPSDFDVYVEVNGIDDTTYPTEAQRLEVARRVPERCASARAAHRHRARRFSLAVPSHDIILRHRV